jgi:hypothetical protein
MPSIPWLGILALCVLLASAETLHGIARTVWVVPRLGKDVALRLSVVTGTALAAAICWFYVPTLGLRGALPHLALGWALAAFMASFDVALGLWLLRKPWRKVRSDFDPRSGNYLLFGLIALSGVPWMVWALRMSG